jgi:hypothetical protein
MNRLHFLRLLLKAADILFRSNLPFLSPRLNLMWLDLFLMYRCQADNLRLVFVAALAVFLTVDLTSLTVRLTSPTSSLISSRVPSILTRLITSVV